MLESDYIYDYYALISKSHMSNLFQNYDQYFYGNNFVKVSVLHEISQIVFQDSNNEEKIKNRSVIVRLCPLDPFMNNVDKMEEITWPTIYVTKVLTNMLSLKMNSKVILEPISLIDNEICEVKNIYISPLVDMVGYIC